MTNYVEPLEPALWFSRIEKIANGELGCIERSLRHAAHLLQLTPMPLRQQVGLAIDPGAFETLLEAGDFDTAAKHLVAQPTALDVEAGDGTRTVSARIKCAVLNRNIDGRGDTIADAVLNAWTTCLLALRSELGSDLVSLTAQAAHTGQSEPHRRSSPH
jgi:hypothetical protein